jgi:hypothetical protein
MTKTIAAALAAVVLVTAAVPASAGFSGHRHGHGHKFFKTHSFHHCGFKKVKFFGSHGWTFKFVRHCY